jgi:hypothetical protein
MKVNEGFYVLILITSNPFNCDLRPDYPSKIFADERNDYVLLLESLATDDAI